MPTLAESANAISQGNSDLAGSKQLSRDATVLFTRYQRQVLPLDGFVFWLKTMSDTVQGSLHCSTDKRQLEDETIAINKVIFTTGREIQLFNDVSPNVIWVGSFQGLKFAFTRRSDFYQAAGVFAYSGDAVYPALETQLIDEGSQLSNRTLVVSNSLPAWLALASYNPIWLQPANPGLPLYPSFAVPDNLAPPYGTVHIPPSQTRALQASPYLSSNVSHSQLAADQVKVTIYGLVNNAAQDFLDLTYSYFRDQDVLGIMNMPIVQDEKRTQAELGILAMKKVINFEVSYRQKRINDLVRQLIEHVTVAYFPRDFP